MGIIFRAIASYVRARTARSIARGNNISFGLALEQVYAQNTARQYAEDLSNCFAKNPSVLKRDDPISGRRLWEMYHSSNGNVYVYFVDSGERRIHTR